ncbi:MAG: Na/Pi cotransporter family protein [Clostridia bacterium]|nr:Na/Pi cotransporter family protein [Clostridia bacterium]
METVIFAIIGLLGGVAFFLYGMTIMSSGLEKMTGGSLERALGKMTSNIFKGLALGAGITVAIQSSSALTVMLVGLVNSGVMQFQQTVSVIMGSNIGTTLTAWLLSLVGLEGGNIFIDLLKPSSFAPIAAFIGILMIMASKKQKTKDIGMILVGFSVLMTGMSLMSDAMKPLTELDNFDQFLSVFKNPIVAVLISTAFTGIIQSSAASVGILQSLALSGGVTYGMAIPIILGQNIGTCVTSLISSIGVTKNAKRVAVVHISFNIIGTIIYLIAYYIIDLIFRAPFLDYAVGPLEIAVIHSIFNVSVTIILLPFSKLLIKIAEKVVRGEESKVEEVLIDERLLATPSFAISECQNTTSKMAEISVETLISSVALTDKYSSDGADDILLKEDVLDRYEDKLGSYIVKLSGKSISDTDSRRAAQLLHCIGDFERIGDHAVNLADVAKEIHEKKIDFSPTAKRELSVLKEAIRDILSLTLKAFTEDSVECATQIEPLEEVIDDIIAEVRANHIMRLQKGQCTIEYGFVLADFLNNIERVSDHCSNVAVSIIDVASMNFDSHEYLQAVKSGDNNYFRIKYTEYRNKYSIKEAN